MFSGDLIHDCKQLEILIKKMKLHTANNRRQINVDAKAPISCVYGLVPFGKYSNGKLRKPSLKYKGWFHSKLKTDYPQYEDYFKTFADLHFPKTFKWSQVVINKNFKTLKHIDASNVGVSYIVGLGDYQDGELVKIDDDETEHVINIKYNPYSFNGSKYYHFTKEFTGDRYSCVFYHNSKLD
tara:strand:+ start:275 stop:820 length:546 start_codon:yes stop_codon:yes gene_type:complete